MHNGNNCYDNVIAIKSYFHRTKRWEKRKKRSETVDYVPANGFLMRSVLFVMEMGFCECFWCMQNGRYATFLHALLSFFVCVYGIMWPTYPLTSYSSASASILHSLQRVRGFAREKWQKCRNKKNMQILKKSSAFVYVCQRTMNEVGNKNQHINCASCVCMFVYQCKLIAMHHVLCAKTLAQKYTVNMWHGAMRLARIDATTLLWHNGNDPFCTWFERENGKKTRIPCTKSV